MQRAWRVLRAPVANLEDELAQLKYEKQWVDEWVRSFEMGHFYIFFLGQSGSGRIQSQDCGLSGAQVFTKGSMQRHALADPTRKEQTICIATRYCLVGDCWWLINTSRLRFLRYGLLMSWPMRMVVKMKSNDGSKNKYLPHMSFDNAWRHRCTGVMLAQDDGYRP